MASNRSNPTTFSAHAKGEIMQGLKVISMESLYLREEGREGALFYYLISALSTSSSLDTSGYLLIDSGA